jgi:hypothetical protein
LRISDTRLAWPCSCSIVSLWRSAVALRPLQSRIISFAKSLTNKADTFRPATCRGDFQEPRTHRLSLSSIPTFAFDRNLHGPPLCYADHVQLAAVARHTLLSGSITTSSCGRCSRLSLRLLRRRRAQAGLAFCWSHLRRRFYELYVGGRS